MDLLGQNKLKGIEEGRFDTPKVHSAQDALDKRNYEVAEAEFRQALNEDPGNPMAARGLAGSILGVLALGGKSVEKEAALAASAQIKELYRRFPNDPPLLANLAIVNHFVGDNITAKQAVHRIAGLGVEPEDLLDPRVIERIEEGAPDAEPDYTPKAEVTNDSWWIGGVLVSCAILWVLVMFVLGALLAVSIPRTPGPMALSGASRSRREVWLERFYLAVLSLGLVGFYLSVPIVVLGLLTVTFALFLLLLALRFIHIGVLYRGFWATGNVLRCAFIGPQNDVLGIEADEHIHRRLFQASREVAERLQTRPFDQIYLTPSSSIAVRQQGTGPFGLFGRRQRVLEVGIVALRLVTTREFKAILAHEYGHFTHNDPYYGRFIFQVSCSLASSLEVMSAAGGVLNMINPFHWFWWLYLKAYGLLSTGFSRSREFLADRRAVLAYGKDTFVAGLTKVLVDGPLFQPIIHAKIQQMLVQGRTSDNVFEAFSRLRESTVLADSHEERLSKLREEKPSWFDNHPSFSERLAAVADFPDGDASSIEAEPAEELISDLQAVEARLTRILTLHVYESLDGSPTEE